MASRSHSSAQADQRRLHAWPAWDESVSAARLRLEFNPEWTPQPDSPAPPQYVRWRQAVELGRLLAEANRALIDLHLPVRFRDYWLACFLAPYERHGFARILDPQPSGDVTTERVYPPPMELWFEAGIDFSSVPYKVLIEGPAALASSVTLRAAVRRALESKSWSGFQSQHPLMRSRQLGPVAEDRAAARGQPNPDKDLAMRHARTWAMQGDKPEFIAYRLTQRGYQVSARTVRRWLDTSPEREI